MVCVAPVKCSDSHFKLRILGSWFEPSPRQSAPDLPSVSSALSGCSNIGYMDKTRKDKLWWPKYHTSFVLEHSFYRFLSADVTELSADAICCCSFYAKFYIFASASIYLFFFAQTFKLNIFRMAFFQKKVSSPDLLLLLYCFIRCLCVFRVI